MLKHIYDKLKEDNLNPHFIGQHQGPCTEPYVIVKQGNQLATLGTNMTGQQIVDIIIYVPINSFIVLDPYKKEIRTALSELGYLRKTGLETPAIVDDRKKGYTSSIEYVLHKKLEG